MSKHQVNVLTCQPGNLLTGSRRGHVEWCLSQLPDKDLERLVLGDTYFLGLIDRSFTCLGRDLPQGSVVVCLDTAFFRIWSRHEPATLQLLLAALARELAPLVAEGDESPSDVLVRWGVAKPSSDPRLASIVGPQHQRSLETTLLGPLREHVKRLNPSIITARGMTWALPGAEVSPPSRRLILLDQQLLSLLDGSPDGIKMVEGVLAHELAHIEYERLNKKHSTPSLAGEAEIDAMAATWGFGPGLRAFHQHSLDTNAAWMSEIQISEARHRIALLR